MTREEFEVYKTELMERFYWCMTRNELNYLTKEKGNKYLFRCTHYKTNRYFWVFDKTDALLKDVADFRMEKSNTKESDSVATDRES